MNEEVAFVAEDFSDYKEFIFNSVSFVGILRAMKLEPEDSSTGKYTHRMICPFKFHKNGNERTGSFRFNENTKSFICFGCGTSGTILDFLRLYVGGCEQYHLRKLARMAGIMKDGQLQLPENYVVPQNVIKESNYRILFDCGLVLRQYLLDIRDNANYNKECEWADKLLTRMDEHFNSIGSEDIEGAKQFYDGLKSAVEKRKRA